MGPQNISRWGRAAGYQPPPQVMDRGTTFRYGGQLRTKQIHAVWWISSGRSAATESSERSGSRVALATATKYLRSMTLWHGEFELPQKLKCHRCLVVWFFNQRLGEGHPDRKPRRTAALGRMWSELCEWPAVYRAFARQTARGTHCLRHSMTDTTTMNSLPHRSSHGLPRSTHGGAPLATCDKWAIAGNLKTTPPPLQLRSPLSAGTWNIRTSWSTGASWLLVEQLSKAQINIMGLQVRWYNSGQLNIDNYTLLWSGPPAGSPRYAGVALAIDCLATRSLHSFHGTQ